MHHLGTYHQGMQSQGTSYKHAKWAVSFRIKKNEKREAVVSIHNPISVGRFVVINKRKFM
jgi:hypothetical protein